MTKPATRWGRGILAAALLFVLAVPTGFIWNLARPVLHKDLINKYAAVYKFDPLLIMAIVKVESRFMKSARSHRGAIGLMQLMPVTAMEMARRVGRPVPLEEIENPDVNIHLGLHYLSLLRADHPQDVVAMLASYNAGPANVREWMKSGPLTTENVPYGETRLFVKKVLSTHMWLKRFQRVKNVFH